MSEFDKNEGLDEEFEKNLSKLQSKVESLEDERLSPEEKQEKIEKGLLDAVKDIDKGLKDLNSKIAEEANSSVKEEVPKKPIKDPNTLNLNNFSKVDEMGEGEDSPINDEPKPVRKKKESIFKAPEVDPNEGWVNDAPAANAVQTEFVVTNKSKTGAIGFKMFLAILPFVILTLLFSYFPLHGWIYAFFDYKPPIKLSDSEFVGLRWFKMLFGNSVQIKQMAQVLINTFAMSFIGIATSILPMLFAVFLNEIKSEKFKNLIQTFTALPNFISWVMVYSIAFCLFSDSGMINTLLNNAGIITTPIKFLDSDSHTYLWMTLWSIWKGLGWGAIMYLAAITTIDPELFEAAKVEGGTRFQLMRYITIPSIMPTFMVLLMMAIANFLNNGIDQYYVFQNSFNKEHIQVLDLYVYNVGMTGSSLSLAAAISMLKSIISVVLLTMVNFVSKKTRGESII